MKAFLDYAYTPLGEDKDNALSFDIYASLVATNEQLFGRFGTRLHVVRGVISLDTAVYDIPAMMKANPTEIYTHVFGKDPEVWADASPATHVRLGKKIPPFLVVYASKMPAREYQSAHFVAKLRKASRS
jgi:hypothetical protein